MKRILLSILLLSLLSFTACDWHIFGEDEIAGENWDLYDYVFAGPSPDPAGDPMYFKLNIDENNVVTGETLGVFYSEVTGVLTDDILELDIVFQDIRCNETAFGTFIGEFSEEELTGELYLEACEILEYSYAGTRVGGSK
ncbi:MAG TPA: hypothetical protein PKW95_00805 [bacterium]|nr:hypothetical protein [bacterium]